MKKAIVYLRVSTDEQAEGYSLGYQEERLVSYCERNEINPVVIFREDASGKTIDGRPELKKALDYAKKNKKEIDYFLVLKWDRFSRSAHDAFVLIKLFENLGITVQAIEQPIDFNVPEQLVMLGVYITFPESENRRRSLNIRGGIRRAKKLGRYCTAAPFGYSYKKDSSGKKVLVPNEKAHIVKTLFTEFAKGIYSYAELRRYCRKNFNRYFTKNYFKDLLSNVVYVGKIKIDKQNDEPERIIDGVHEPIIDWETFETVGMILSGKKRSWKVVKGNEKYPLRGMLICPQCGNNLTASSSRGRNAHFDYYHCRRPCNERNRSELVHEAVQELVGSYKLAPEWAEIAQIMIEKKIKESTAHFRRESNSLQSELQKIEEKLLLVDEKFVLGELNAESYQRLMAKYDQEKVALKFRLAEYQKPDSAILEQTSFGLNVLANLDRYYLQANAQAKVRLLGSIFPGKLIYENGKCRTAEINPAVEILFNKINSLNSPKTKIHDPNIVNFVNVETTGIEPVSENKPPETTTCLGDFGFSFRHGKPPKSAGTSSISAEAGFVAGLRALALD